MKCTILPNHSFKKDGSCKREKLCDIERLRICKPIRREKSKILLKLIVKRGKTDKKLLTAKDATEYKEFSQALEEVETEITKMLRE